jgi:hypothetical protein
VIGVAYESGAGARTMTASLLGRWSSFGPRTCGSEAVGERIRLGAGFRPPLTATVLAAGEGMLAVLLLAAERLVH